MNAGIALERAKPVLFSVAAADWLDLKKPGWSARSYVIAKTDIEHLKLREWGQQFPKRKQDHYVFPSERVGFSSNDQIPHVFGTDPIRPITSWKLAWTTVRTAAGVLCRFHDLRHTTVTRLLERGVAFAVVATIMGWSASTALRMAKRYSHIGQSPQRAALALLDAKPMQPEPASASTPAPDTSTIQ